MSIRARSPNPIAETKVVGRAAIPFADLKENNFAWVRQAIGDAQVVLLGEASHGTEEFYQIRSEITKALIENEGFSAVLCEADFPAFYDINRFIGAAPESRCIRGGPKETPPKSADAAMQKLKNRFPVWMWRNSVFKELVEWLKETNGRRQLEKRPPVHLNGLDIYSMFESSDEVIEYLEQVDEKLAAMARRSYETLDTFRPEAFEYCRAVYQGRISSQAPKVASMLTTLNSMCGEFSSINNDGDEFFNAVENARVVGAAEEYYRKSFMGGNVTWNIRDDAMVKMIEHMIEFQERQMKKVGSVGRPRVIVWAHNSHVGDSLATEHHERRQYNVGRLVRDRFGDDNSFILGFSTYTGTVRAARAWNGRDYVMHLNESLPNSSGNLFHGVANDLGQADFAVLTRSNGSEGLTKEELDCRQVLRSQRLQRFVGVQYVKQTERQSHYSYCSIGEQYDMVVHIDKTNALRTLKAVLAPSPRPGTLDYRKFENFEETSDEEMEDGQGWKP